MGANPSIANVCMDDYIQSLDGKYINVHISYQGDNNGIMKLYYKMPDSDYSDEESISVDLAQYTTGQADFMLEYQQGMLFKLVLPEENIKITKLAAGICEDDISYGYDGPFVGKNKSVRYMDGLHTYNLVQMPLIWAEKDERKAVDNHVAATVSRKSKNLFVFKPLSLEQKKDGNYILLNTGYSGNDDQGNEKNDDEFLDSILKLGTYVDGKFVVKYEIHFSAKEGCHNYLFRVSTDYYWHIDDINAVEISDGLVNSKMKLLQGD